jgi:hypothetical protein
MLIAPRISIRKHSFEAVSDITVEGQDYSDLEGIAEAKFASSPCSLEMNLSS